MRAQTPRDVHSSQSRRGGAFCFLIGPVKEDIFRHCCCSEKSACMFGCVHTLGHIVVGGAVAAASPATRQKEGSSGAGWSRVRLFRYSYLRVILYFGGHVGDNSSRRDQRVRPCESVSRQTKWTSLVELHEQTAGGSLLLAHRTASVS